MKKRILSLIIIGAFSLGVGSTILPTKMDYSTKTVSHVLLADPEVGMTVVALGANNNQEQQNQLLQGFGVSKSDENVMFLKVTNRDIAKEEGYQGNLNNIQNENSFSSVKVTILPKGSGIQVSTNNLTMVTGNMLASALTTCGINNASIVANAPMPVTGQAALAGVMMAFTKATGDKIPEANKVAANNEVNTTSNIAKTVGQKKAEQIVTQAKSLVIKDNPNSTIEVNNIVNNVVNNNGVENEITPEQKQQLANLMEEIKQLNLKESSVEKTLNNIQESIKNGKKNFTELSHKLQQELQNNHEAIEKTENILQKIWHWIVSFFKGGEKAVQNEQSNALLNVVDFSTITPDSQYNTLRNQTYGDVISYLESQNISVTRNIQDQVINAIKAITDNQIQSKVGENNTANIVPVVGGKSDGALAQFDVVTGNTNDPTQIISINFNN